MAELTLKKKLQDKVAIVTGGASGIGEATARLFSLNGVRAMVIADVQDDKGQDVAASIGAHCSYIRCDVSDEDQVKSLVESTVQMHGRLDIMFSNAGIISKSKQEVLDLDLSNYDKLMAVNVRGMAACVKHAAKAMVEGGVRGSVICTASVGATNGTEIFTDYTMSKHAILGLVRCASIQLAPHRISVNCVSPGPTLTPIMNSSTFQFESQEEVDKLQSTLGFKGGKDMMTPEHVASAVVYLASEDSPFVSGHNLVLDGGFKT
ncbi:(+)-cis,trans-nepetalactol synthase NEPS1 [Rosa sericea]